VDPTRVRTVADKNSAVSHYGAAWPCCSQLFPDRTTEFCSVPLQVFPSDDPGFVTTRGTAGDRRTRPDAARIANSRCPVSAVRATQTKQSDSCTPGEPRKGRTGA